MRKFAFSFLLAYVFLFASAAVSCHNGDPDYPTHDDIRYEYKIDLDGYELSRAYGSSVYEYSIPSVWDDKVNGQKPVVRIGSDSFASWRWLRDVSVPSTVRQIGDSAFSDLQHLEGVRFAEDCPIDKIGEYAFAYCTALKKIEVPANVESVGRQTYTYCEGACEVSFMKSNGASALKEISESAFYGCSGISSVTIPSGVVKIDRTAFANCYKLAKIDFESGSALEIIQDGAFSRCSKLSELKIPRGVRFIGRKILSGRGKNLVIKFEGTEAEWNGIAKDAEWDGGSDNEITMAYLGNE